MTIKSTIYIPRDVLSAGSLLTLRAALIAAAGGLTVVQGEGYWERDDGVIVRDSVSLYMSFHTENQTDAVDAVYVTIMGELFAAGESVVVVEVQRPDGNLVTFCEPKDIQ